jgi:hypothetical protein
MNFIPTLIRAKMNDKDLAEAITSTYEKYYSTLSRHGQQTVDTVRTVIHKLLPKKKRISDRVKMVALADDTKVSKEVDSEVDLRKEESESESEQFEDSFLVRRQIEEQVDLIQPSAELFHLLFSTISENIAPIAVRAKGVDYLFVEDNGHKIYDCADFSESVLMKRRFPYTTVDSLVLRSGKTLEEYLEEDTYTKFKPCKYVESTKELMKQAKKFIKNPKMRLDGEIVFANHGIVYLHYRGSDCLPVNIVQEECFVPYPTFRDLIRSFFAVKNHHFENNYELYCNVSLKRDSRRQMRCALEFDYGS